MSASLWFGAKNGLPTFVNSLVDLGRQVGKCLCSLQQNMLFLIKSNSKCLSYALEEAKATLVLSILLVSCEEKDCYRDFSIEQVSFGSRSILRAQPVYAMAWTKYFFFEAFSIFEPGGITKHLMTGPSGNSEFCSPSTSMFPQANIEGLGETKLTVSLVASH